MGHADTHRELHGLFNARDFDGMRPKMRDEFTYEDRPRNLTMKSVSEFIDWLGGWTTAFSNARVDEPQYLDGGDFSVAVFRGRGDNDGPLGPLPATGKQMDMPYCEILRYDADRRAASGEIFYDQLTMLTQLGHAEPRAPSA